MENSGYSSIRDESLNKLDHIRGIVNDNEKIMIGLEKLLQAHNINTDDSLTDEDEFIKPNAKRNCSMLNIFEDENDDDDGDDYDNDDDDDDDDAEDDNTKGAVGVNIQTKVPMSLTAIQQRIEKSKSDTIVWRKCNSILLQQIEKLINKESAKDDDLKKFQLKTALEDFEEEKREVDTARKRVSKLKQELSELHNSLKMIDSSELRLPEAEKLHWLANRRYEVLGADEGRDRINTDESYDTVN